MEGSFLWTVGSTHKREQGNERKESLGQAKVRRYEIAYDVHKIRFCKATTGESQRRPHFCALAWNRKTSSIASAPISDSSAVWRWTQRETQIKPRENKWKRAEISHLTGTSSARGATSDHFELSPTFSSLLGSYLAAEFLLLGLCRRRSRTECERSGMGLHPSVMLHLSRQSYTSCSTSFGRTAVRDIWASQLRKDEHPLVP